MSDINTYADEAAITALSNPINGDLVLNQDNNSLYLCTDAELAGLARWKKFANDAEAEAFLNRWDASFNGSSAYLDTGSNFKSTFQSDFTIALWVKINEFGHGKALIAADSGTNYDHRFSIFTTENGNKIGSFYQAAGIGTSALFNNSSVNWATWNHVAYSYAQNGSAVDVKVYLNGSLDASNSTGGVTLANFSESGETAKTLFLGARHGVDGKAQAFTNVNLDEVAIFSSALSTPEVASLIDSSGSNLVPADLSSFINNGLAAYWRMGDDSNDSPVDTDNITGITDSSGNGNDATTIANAQPTFSALASSETIYV